MKYITTRELSEKWNVSQRRIVCLAQAGRIDGAALHGKSWMFPENAEKPSDARTRAGKEEKQRSAVSFRYPIFEFKDISSFNPPLTEEEKIIKAVIEKFNACRISEANEILGALPERAQNKYIRITALYCGCMICIFLCDTGRFSDYYGRLKTELSEDFPHKAEMSEYIHLIDSCLGEDKYYAEEFRNNPAYRYHESFLPRLCNLSSLRITLGGKQISPEDLTASEIYCAFLEKTDNVFDLQALHIYLACAYSMLNKQEECNHHFVRALKLAEKYEIYYTIATMQYYYMSNALEDALKSFSPEFIARIKKCNNDFSKNYIRFVNALQMNSLYKSITVNDYFYIIFAVWELNNKEIAKRMHVSAATVCRRYSEIYTQLGVSGKKELSALYSRLTDNTLNKKPAPKTRKMKIRP